MRLSRANYSSGLDRTRLRRTGIVAWGAGWLALIGAASAAIAPGKPESPGAGAVAVPNDPDWAKYVLLAVIWTLVIAAVIGPVYRFFVRKTTPSDHVKHPGW